MSDDLAVRITALQRRVSDAQRAQARAEADHAAAEAHVTTLREQLRTEFGITSLDDAHSWLAASTAEIAILTTALERTLDDGSTP